MQLLNCERAGAFARFAGTRKVGGRLECRMDIALAVSSRSHMWKTDLEPGWHVGLFIPNA